MAVIKSRIESSVEFIQDVLDDFHAGQLLIPRFQRPLVWDIEMRRTLLDSIFEEIPIGSFMIWRTRRTEMKAKETLGPFTLPRLDIKQTPHRYLLDGEQRLSTLYFSLFEPYAPRELRSVAEEPPEAYRAYFDLIEQCFLFESERTGKPQSWHLPLSYILDGTKVAKFKAGLSDSYKRARSHPSIDVLWERADTLSNRFTRYKLPKIELVTDDLPFVTRTFVRVNRQHQVMSELDMISALSGLNWTESLSRIRSETHLPYGWDELDEQVVLRTCKAVMGLAVYGENPEEISKNLGRDGQILEDIAQRLAATARFFYGICKMRAPSMVPYDIQIVLIAAALKPGADIEGAANQRLEDWIWLTSILEVFRRQPTEVQFNKQLKDVQDIIQGKSLNRDHKKELPIWREPASTFVFRHGRSRLRCLLLADQKPWDPARKKAINGYALLALRGYRAMAQFPGVKVNRAQSIGARFLVPPESAKDLFDGIGGGSIPEKHLKSHLIDEDMQRAIRAGDIDEFILRRESKLNTLEKARYEEILERLYAPTAPEPEPTTGRRWRIVVKKPRRAVRQ